MNLEEEYLYFEEEYFAKDRKSARRERKQISNKDRSKFRKSDQDQLKKQQLQESPLRDSSLLYGKVLSIGKEVIYVDCAGEQFLCTLKGALKKQYNRMKNLIAVGDNVWFERREALEGSIVSIEERTSILSRADALSRIKEQLIAVNIDQLIITCSLVAPLLKSSLVDRYIIAAHKGKMKPVIAINKIDLLENPPAHYSPEIIAQEKELFAEFIAIYRSLGFRVIALSAVTGEGIEDLKRVMQGKSSVFSGQSGVGKSHLISQVTGLDLLKGQVVKKTSKGSHTTSRAHLVHLGENCFCIDTPGIKSFGLWDVKSDEVKNYFSEIDAQSTQCKFPDCRHIDEPDCAVKAAVEQRVISPLRFASYCALMMSLKEEQHGRR